jgi:tetratricopeptide (TPR) repeat protein
MQKYFTILFFSLAISLPASSQNIDSLKKALPTAKDTERINCLNRLATVYYYFNEDSGLLYAEKAYNEASRLNSPRGKAFSLFSSGMIKMYETDFEQGENYFHQSIRWFEKSGDTHGLGEAILFTAISLHWQIKLEEAIVAYEQSLPYLQKTGDSADIANTLGMIGLAYENKGEYEKSLEYEKKCLKICKAHNYPGYLIYSYYYLSQLYKAVGDYETALKYLLSDVQLVKAYPKYDLPPNVPIAEIYCLSHQYDSALYYVKPYLNFPAADYAARAVLCMGEIHLMQHNYNNALKNFLPFLNGAKKTQEVGVLQALLGVTKAYEGMQMINETLRYAKELLQTARKANARQYIRDAAYFLSTAYAKKKQFDSSYLYQKLYILMKDSVASNQYLFKLAAYKDEAAAEQKNAEIQLLQSDQKIKEQQLSKEYLQKNFLIIGIIVLVLLSFIIVRVIMLKRKNEKNRRELAENELQLQKLESEKTKVELRQQATELEMQALRAQMNPHFIFNSLNSINRFILQNNKSQASEYLTKFSRLVRLILQNSQVALISLESELESLQLYLELEAVRFDNQFDFTVRIDEEVDASVLKVPPLIIQPYVENAIWHGLMHKEEKGHLDIMVTQEKDHLLIKITDDGIGRKQAALFASKSATRHKSVGLRITADRIAMLNKSNEMESPVKINDLINTDDSTAGTEVIIKIPVLYD